MTGQPVPPTLLDFVRVLLALDDAQIAELAAELECRGDVRGAAVARLWGRLNVDDRHGIAAVLEWHADN